MAEVRQHKWKFLVQIASYIFFFVLLEMCNILIYLSVCMILVKCQQCKLSMLKFRMIILLTFLLKEKILINKGYFFSQIENLLNYTYMCISSVLFIYLYMQGKYKLLSAFQNFIKQKQTNIASTTFVQIRSDLNYYSSTSLQGDKK